MDQGIQISTGSEPWHSRPMAVDANCFPLMRAELDDLVASYCPPLLLEDAVGLIVFGLSKRLIVTLAPRGVPLVNEFRANCEGAALEIVANSHLELLHRAGIVPVLAHPCPLGQPLVSWWKRWCAVMPTPMSALDDLDDRRRCILRIASSIMRETLSMDLLRGVRAGVYASRKEHGKPKRDPDDNPASFAAAFWAMPPSDEKEDRCYTVGPDNRIHISSRYVRDQQGRPPRKKGHVVKERTFSELAPEVALDALESLEGLQLASEATEAAAAAEADHALEEVVRELRKLKLGAVEVIMLDHAKELVDGETTPSDLAQERGLSERTARDTWQRLRALMAAHPRLRGFLRSA